MSSSHQRNCLCWTARRRCTFSVAGWKAFKSTLSTRLRGSLVKLVLLLPCFAETKTTCKSNVSIIFAFQTQQKISKIKGYFQQRPLTALGVFDGEKSWNIFHSLKIPTPFSCTKKERILSVHALRDGQSSSLLNIPAKGSGCLSKHFSRLVTVNVSTFNLEIGRYKGEASNRNSAIPDHQGEIFGPQMDFLKNLRNPPKGLRSGSKSLFVIQSSRCQHHAFSSLGKAFLYIHQSQFWSARILWNNLYQGTAKSPLQLWIQKLEALAEVLAWISCGSLDTKSRAFTNEFAPNDAKTIRHLISIAPDMQPWSCKFPLSRISSWDIFTSVSSACWHFLWGSRCGIEFTPVFKAQPQGKSGSRENPKSLLSQETNCHSWALR